MMHMLSYIGQIHVLHGTDTSSYHDPSVSSWLDIRIKDWTNVVSVKSTILPVSMTRLYCHVHAF
jgi:hypothetical protein